MDPSLLFALFLMAGAPVHAHATPRGGVEGVVGSKVERIVVVPSSVVQPPVVAGKNKGESK